MTFRYGNTATINSPGYLQEVIKTLLKDILKVKELWHTSKHIFVSLVLNVSMIFLHIWNLLQENRIL